MTSLRINDFSSTALILLFLMLLLHFTGLFARVDNLIFDIGQKYYVSPAPDDIVIVAIDENSVAQLGRWPWSRQIHANVIERLQPEHARAIGLDIVFSEPDLGNQSVDDSLALAIQKAGNVVLPVLIETTRVNGQLLETLPLPALTE